ncbi:hypothetical protein FRC08_004697 [Ceratobasidium sp. 394]|nr:hypothetical protein FRC08_004697 [Ceratobasidium sp. 394]
MGLLRPHNAPKPSDRQSRKPWITATCPTSGRFQHILPRLHGITWHIHHKRSHNTIGWVLEELDEQVTAFKFPTRLAFSEPSSDGQVPRLAKARMNQPLADHRSSLEYLLDVLGEVQSNGDPGVKVARAAAIQRVRSELAELKQKKAAAWRNQLRRDAWPLWSGW